MPENNQQQQTQNQTSNRGFGNHFGIQDGSNIPFAPKKEKGQKPKGEKKTIQVDPDTFESSTETWITTKNRLCERFSYFLRQVFSDYIGCNYDFDPMGNYLLKGFFSVPNNPNALYQAFEQISTTKGGSVYNQKGVISNIIGGYSNFEITDKLYQPTADGIDVLSDIIKTDSKAERDKEGRLKNFTYNKYYFQSANYKQINPMQNGYNVAPSSPIYAYVYMDDVRLLRYIFGDFNQKTGGRVQYEINISTSPVSASMMASQQNPLVVIMRPDEGMLRQLGNEIGIVPASGSIELH